MLEVLIALGICAIALTWILSSTSNSLHKQMGQLQKIDRQRTFELEFFDWLYSLRQQKSFNPKTGKHLSLSKEKATPDGKRWRTYMRTIEDKRHHLNAQMKVLLCVEKNSSTLHGGVDEGKSSSL